MKILLLSFILLGLYGFCLGAGGGGVSSSTSSGGGSMKETEDTKRLREGRPLILTCEQNATNLETKWTKDGNELVAGDHIQLFPNTTLYISTAQKEDKGEYSCKTGSMTEPKIFHVVELTLQKHLPKSTTVLENDKLSLSCQVQGDPELTVQWLKDGEPVEDTDNSTRLEMSDNEYDVPNAVLSIKPIQKSDSGNYVCLISLYSINVNTTTVVRVKDIYAALWPFLGIVAEVVILCLIIFIYEKRRIKANFDDSDSDPAQDVKNNVDGKKENDIRQRKH
ncbi:hypothetical protein Pmani_032372 [Petrolisthes manimaculis]|uniref:Ig-like domain-containing protein n=1 Tax=Petrolisthes manimaculis TaxID=1843537 RepID=A0AAE1TR37_9EUCA|nr:hypothetical protein Pmani_032372 [Petrolisthes manimaculis]